MWVRRLTPGQGSCSLHLPTAPRSTLHYTVTVWSPPITQFHSSDFNRHNYVIIVYRVLFLVEFEKLTTRYFGKGVHCRL